MNYKAVFVLLFVLVMSLVVAFLVWRLDFFVHGDLYAYGLFYSRDWADPYWYFVETLWAFLGGATIFASVSAILQYLHNKHPRDLLKWAGVFLPMFALVYEGISIYFLDQKNLIVWNTLKDYGLRYSGDWATIYNLISQFAVALMAVTLFALIISAVIALSSAPVATSSTNQSRDKASVTPQDLEKAVKPPETNLLLEREETEPKSSTSPIPTKEMDNTVKLASEEKKLDRVWAETSAIQKPAKRRRKRRRKKARASRAKAGLNTTKTGA
jgi:hypothetical protein